LLQEFSEKKILIIGDVMIDRYVYGSVNRISPEAPVPVLEWKKTENRLGGAANVALNIKALGAIPYLLGIAGDDDDGLIFRQLLAEQGIENQHIVLVGGRPTTVKSRMMAGGQQLLRLDQETTADNDENTEAILLTKMRYLVENQGIDVIVFQDYNKGLLTKTMIKKALSLAQKHKIPTCVDPKKKNFTAYQNVTLFKPNLKEISVFFNKNIIPNLVELKIAASEFRAKAHYENLMITLSEKGIFIENEEENAILPTTPRHIADVCGAGDTVISVAALGIACGFDMKKIAQYCNIAGGQVCEEIGVVPINKAKFWKEISANIVMDK
jgi:rfaE bifunctional protein kinase chain/domain